MDATQRERERERESASPFTLMKHLEQRAVLGRVKYVDVFVISKWQRYKKREVQMQREYKCMDWVRNLKHAEEKRGSVCQSCREERSLKGKRSLKQRTHVGSSYCGRNWMGV